MDVGCEIHAPGPILPGKYPATHWIGGWVGPRAGLDAVGKTETPFPVLTENRASVIHPVA
jgi:hypothetical protein